MNVLSLFDRLNDISANIGISNVKYPFNLVRFLPPLTFSLSSEWICLKLLSSLLSNRSFSSSISSKLFEDFNRLLEEDEVHCLPSVLVDLNAFDRNTSTLRNEISYFHPSTTIRIASKSIRVPCLLKRILSSGLPFKGLMCFSVEEAEFLCDMGFDDILIGYPSQQKLDYQILRNLHDKEEKLIRIVVDDSKSIIEMNQFLNGIKKAFPIILEIDVSFRLLQGRIHIGARRSPIRTISQLIEMIELIKTFPNIQQMRKDMSQLCLQYGLTLFNGGGTGSLLSTLNESSVLTEITVGSGFFQPHLFDHYQQNELMMNKSKNTFLPSCYFALPIVRISDEGEWITCLGGGYVASGKPGWDKIPIPVFPIGLTVSNDEGAGEVQTPLKINPKTKIQTMEQLKHNQIVYFRHAKGGELAERFQQFLLVENGKIVEVAKTYRGFGKAFF